MDRPVHRHHRYFERGHQLGHRHRAHRRHHRGPQVRACRHRIRCFRGHRQQGAAGQVRPGDLLRRRGQGRRHLLRGRCRWCDSVPAPAARVPGRRQGDQHARHRQRHHQLHSRRDDHQGSPVRRRAQGRPGQGLRRSRSDRRHRRLRCCQQGRHHGHPRLPHLRDHRRRVRRRHHQDHRRRHRRRHRRAQGHQAARRG